MLLSALLIAGVPLAAFTAAVFVPHFGFVAAGALGPIIELMRRRAALGNVSIAAQRLAAGELDVRAEGGAASDDLADSLGRIRDRLAAAADDGTSNAAHADAVREAVGETRALIDAVTAQTAAIATVAVQLDDMVTTLQTNADSAGTLVAQASTCSATAAALAGDGALDGDAGRLETSVADSSESIAALTRSVTGVADRVAELARTAEETSATMHEMDTSIDDVRRNAAETVRLSEQVAEVANHGFDVLEQTIVGIHKIKDSSQQATQVMDALGAKIGEIVKIVQVIDDVAEQTNLLALNAAIIAAQAGEHGKGFAVVADEIKDLAERAGVSTKEIAELIVAVQDQTSNAITAVEAGSVLVDQGVRLSIDAEDALRKIVEAAEQSRAMVDNIAKATAEQAASSKRANDSIHRMTDTVHVIATATTEQSQGFARVTGAAASMRELSARVATTAAARGHSTRELAGALAQLGARVSELGEVHRRQASAASRAAEAVDRIRRALDERGARIDALRGSLSRLESSNAPRPRR